jgi:uncharacterized protein (TIGR02265 family)
MTEKLIFAQTFEGLLRSLGARLSPRLSAGLRERGLDPTATLLPAYPQQVFIEVLSFLAVELHPGQPLEVAITSIGRGFMDAYGETMVGRAMMAMMRLIGPRRTLERVTRQFRTGNNFSETRLTPVSATEYHLWVNEVRLPGWYIGILSRGLELAGGKEVKVELLQRDDSGGSFRVKWAV